MEFCGFDMWSGGNSNAALYRSFLLSGALDLKFGPSYARGTGAGCLGDNSSGDAYLTRTLDSPSAYFLMGIAFKRTQSANATDGSEHNKFLYFSNQINLTFSPAGKIQVRSGGSYSGTVLGTTSKTYTVGLYHYITVAVYVHGTAGYVKIYDEGEKITPALSLTGLNTNPAATGVIGSWTVRWGWPSYNYHYIDDLYWTSTQAEVEAGPLGNMKVMSAKPTADGSVMTFTPSTGTVAWSLVDDDPVDGADFVTANSIGNKLGLRFSTDTTGREIYGVQADYWVKSDEGSSRARIDCISGGSTGTGVAALPVNTTGTVIRQVFMTNPAGNVPWTAESLSAAEFILERTG